MTDTDGNEIGKLFVGGLSQATNDDSLHSYFSQFGELESMIVMMDNKTGRSRGFGYVKYKNSIAVDLVLESKPHILDGKEIDAKQCNINLKGKNRRSLKIFVGGIGLEYNPVTLQQFFEQFGKVTDVNLMMDDAKQRHRGFAFIGFEDEAVVKHLISLHFVNMGSKQVEIKAMEPPNFSRKINVKVDPVIPFPIEGNTSVNIATSEGAYSSLSQSYQQPEKMFQIPAYQTPYGFWTPDQNAVSNNWISVAPPAFNPPTQWPSMDPSCYQGIPYYYTYPTTWIQQGPNQPNRLLSHVPVLSNQTPIVQTPNLAIRPAIWDPISNKFISSGNFPTAGIENSTGPETNTKLLPNNLQSDDTISSIDFNKSLSSTSIGSKNPDNLIYTNTNATRSSTLDYCSWLYAPKECVKLSSVTTEYDTENRCQSAGGSGDFCGSSTNTGMIFGGISQM